MPLCTEFIISCVFAWSEASYSTYSLNLSRIPLCLLSFCYSLTSISDATWTCAFSVLLGSCRLLNFFLNFERYPPYSSSYFSWDTWGKLLLYLCSAIFASYSVWTSSITWFSYPSHNLVFFSFFWEFDSFLWEVCATFWVILLPTDTSSTLDGIAEAVPPSAAGSSGFKTWAFYSIAFSAGFAASWVILPLNGLESGACKPTIIGFVFFWATDLWGKLWDVIIVYFASY